MTSLLSVASIYWMQVLSTAYVWSPLAYCLTFVGHLCAFRWFACLYWAKTRFMSQWIEEKDRE